MNNTENEVGLIYVGSWRAGWPELGHDGKPYESDRFVIYSDKSSQATRVEVARDAEIALEDLLEIFQIDFEKTWIFFQITLPEKSIFSRIMNNKRMED